MGSLAPTSINTTANIDNDSGTSITWEVPSGATGRVIDGVEATGTLAAPVGMGPRTFTATGTSGDYTLTVSGNITGPPPPCTGNGTWQVTTGGQLVGRGSWRIP